MAFTQAFQNKALLTYICAGDPDLGATADVLRALDDAGVDVLEVGVPFSDPVADGPVIQEASTRALARKTSLGGVLEMLHSVKGALRAPRVIMSYVNPLAAYGFDRFARDAREGGVSGVLVPDLPGNGEVPRRQQRQLPRGSHRRQCRLRQQLGIEEAVRRHDAAHVRRDQAQW